MVENDTAPYLSLIMPAYNEEWRIASSIRTARRYLNSLGKPWELIVVDDGSTDATLERIRSCGDEGEPVRVITYEKNRGKGYAVRQGVLASTGRYVAFSDADLAAPGHQVALTGGVANFAVHVGASGQQPAALLRVTVFGDPNGSETLAEEVYQLDVAQVPLAWGWLAAALGMAGAVAAGRRGSARPK